MKALDYYNECEEIEFEGKDLCLELSISGCQWYHPGDNYNTPPDGGTEVSDFEIHKVHLIADDGDYYEITNQEFIQKVDIYMQSMAEELLESAA